MTTEKSIKLDDLLEFKYAETCPYVWPYNADDGVNWDDFIVNDWRYESLQDFYNCHSLLELLNYEAYT